MIEYEQGKVDGFIDSIIITQPVNTNGHTFEKFKEVDAKYNSAIYSVQPSLYQIGYALGVDCGAYYLGYR